MRSQQGISTLGVLIILGLIGFFSLCAYKVVPLYLNNFTVESILENVASLPDVHQMSEYDIRLKIQDLLDINNVREITFRDVKFQRISNGFVMSIPREERVNLFYNLDIIATFDNSVEVVR